MFLFSIWVIKEGKGFIKTWRLRYVSAPLCKQIRYRQVFFAGNHTNLSPRSWNKEQKLHSNQKLYKEMCRTEKRAQRSWAQRSQASQDHYTTVPVASSYEKTTECAWVCAVKAGTGSLRTDRKRFPATQLITFSQFSIFQCCVRAPNFAVVFWSRQFNMHKAMWQS